MTDFSSIRGKRKLEHIQHSLNQNEGYSAMEDVCFINCSVPELSWEDLHTEINWLGKNLSQPLIINAITGGIPETMEINASLARIAAEKKIGMAVGSQSVAITDKGCRQSFMVARKENPEGLLLANVGAGVSPDIALAAVEMIAADGLQLHLNAAQELFMPEGDRDFRGILDNIAVIAAKSTVPVIVKEVGFGISKETAFELFRTGIKWLDIGGSGGTDFKEIEIHRQGGMQNKRDIWGIPTAVSILEIMASGLPIGVIAAGGISNGVDVAKSLALGAKVAAVAGKFLRILLRNSEKALLEEIDNFQTDFKRAMLLTGSKDLPQLGKVPLVVKGAAKQWLDQRGINSSFLARR